MPEHLLIPVILLIPAAIQVVYLLIVYGRFSFSSAKSLPVQNADLPISVIVCGRNEEENFKKYLPKLLTQDYPNYEVVAVNDQSIDNSKDVLEELQTQYPHLRIVDVQENDRFWRGKKFGLTLGIKAAEHEHLLFTDADCEPAGNQWIRQMAAGFAKPGKELVLGFGAYQKSGGFLNMLIRYETLQTAIQYFSLALWGAPYMGVGRNLAYTKSLFFQQKGFVPHMHIHMGDDDLFVNAAATGKNTAVVYTKESFTCSAPEATFGKWFEQKRRHLATSGKYRGGSKFVLGLYGATSVLFYASIVVAFLIPGLPIWVWYALAGRFVLHYFIFTFGAKKTADWDVLLILPVLELILLINQLLILGANRFNKEYKWK